MSIIKTEDDSKIILETLLGVRPDFTEWAAKNFPHLMKDKPIANWEEFIDRVAKFAHEKCPDLFYFRDKSEIVVGRLSLDQDGSIWVSYVDQDGDDRWVHLAGHRTYEQMFKVLESVYYIGD